MRGLKGAEGRSVGGGRDRRRPKPLRHARRERRAGLVSPSTDAGQRVMRLTRVQHGRRGGREGGEKGREREGLQVFIRQLFFAPVARRACSLRRSGAGPIARGGRAGPERHTFETAQSNLMPSASTSTTFGPVVWPLIPSRRDQTRKGSRPADEPCHSGDVGRRAE